LPPVVHPESNCYVVVSRFIIDHTSLMPIDQRITEAQAAWDSSMSSCATSRKFRMRSCRWKGAVVPTLAGQGRGAGRRGPGRHFATTRRRIQHLLLDAVPLPLGIDTAVGVTTALIKRNAATPRRARPSPHMQSVLIEVQELSCIPCAPRGDPSN
jgi:hypothetical protein